MAISPFAPQTLAELPEIEGVRLAACEAGIRTPDDVAKLRAAGVHRILVGEHLLRQPDVGLALRDLMKPPPQDAD